MMTNDIVSSGSSRAGIAASLALGFGLGIAGYLLWSRRRGMSVGRVQDGGLFERQVSASTADASPARNEILEEHFREHPEGDPASRISAPIREPGAASRGTGPANRRVEIHSDRSKVLDLNERDPRRGKIRGYLLYLGRKPRKSA